MLNNTNYKFISIRDIHGKLVIEDKINDGDYQTIDLKNWANGYYTIEIIGYNKVLHHKFLKN
jgi:hypothetical protein